MFQVLFFSMISCKILCKNRFNLFSHFLYNFTKIEIKSFECHKSMRNYKKDNAWNIRLLVNESFVPANQWTSVSYCRLSDFWIELQMALSIIYQRKPKLKTHLFIKKLHCFSRKKKMIVLSSECVLLFRSKTIQRNKRRIFKEKLLLKGFVNPYEIVPNISKV